MTAAPQIFDRPLIAARRAKAIAAAAPGADFLLDLVADDIAQRLSAVVRRFQTAVVVAGPTDAVSRAVLRSGKVDRLIRADVFTPGLGTDPAVEVVLDDELFPFADDSLDLVVSGLSLQWVNDLPGALVQIRRALKPDGLFLGSFVGGDSLTELRQCFLAAESDLSTGATPRVAPFVDVRDLGGLLQRTGFALPVTDQDRLTLRYRSAVDLMRELARMGAANPLRERRKSLTGKDIIARTAASYQERFSDPDGRIRATLTLVSMSGWKPHESQQKPLKPGSAKTRLADALNTVERPLGKN